MNATIEEWMQASDDYLTLCQFLHQLVALFPQRNALLTAEMRQTLFLNCGSILPALLLVVRYAGYGDRIDEALAIFNNFLNGLIADPGDHSISGASSTIAISARDVPLDRGQTDKESYFSRRE